ncbi:hypothetical protein F5Y18DRAFT_375010 [Xylariaceae sp. FL1019]|nr:hypothetical protein F5Y18DRAFT_375010 [Xylariaceae sp. FL1019]
MNNTEMPGRKKKQFSSRVWGPNDVTALLAYLDYCHLYNIDFRHTVVDHLETQMRKGVTWSQIESRLYTEWKYWGAEDSKSWRVLLSEGSRCLRLLTDAEREDIRRAMVKLTPPPQTIPASRSSSTSSVLSSIATQEIEGVTENRHLEFPFSGQRSQTGSCHETIKRNETNSTNSTRRPLSRIDMKEHIDHGHLEFSANLDAGDQHLRAVATRYSGITTELDHQQDLQNAIERERKLQCEVFTLKDHLFAAREECKELRKCHHAAETTKDTTRTLEDLLYQNSVLRKHVLALESSRHDYKSIASGGLGASNRSIQNQLGNIERLIADACASIDIRSPVKIKTPFSPELNESSHPLQLWTHRVSDEDDAGSFLSYCFSCGISELKLIRCLVAAITHGFVFESPMSDLLAMDCPILHHYRTQISHHYGSVALQQLDLLAWKSLISEKHFDKQVIRNQAHALAERTYRLIETILKSDADDLAPSVPEFRAISGSDVESLDVVDETNLPRSAPFVEAFKHALRLKSELILSDDCYRWVFYKPDSPLDLNVMELVDSACEAYKPSPNKDKRVSQISKEADTEVGTKIRLCLFPALFTSPGTKNDKIRSSDIAWERSQLLETVADSTGLVMVKKAVVLV